MVDCPDNSTECLLRALIQQSAGGSPWDLPTFGFTVAIGVLAFSVSWVTVFQGLFAAGPGRLKASSAAIGKFSTLTKTRLSWLELAFRTTARVPIITNERLMKRLEKQTLPTNSGKDYGDDGNDPGTAAGWLQLLRCVGLEEDMLRIETDNGRFGTWDFLAYSTDYLPSDITAPPAAIQLSTLVLLVAFTDDSALIERNGERVQVTGDVSQLSFRQHPILGSLAAYERFETQTYANEYLLGLRLIFYGTRGRCTKFSLELAQGTLQVWNGVHERFQHLMCKDCRSSGLMQLYNFKQPGNYLSHEFIGYFSEPWALALALMAAQSDYQYRPFPWRRMKVEDSFKALWDYIPMLHKDLDEVQKVLEKMGMARQNSIYGKRASRTRVWASLEFEQRGSWANPKGTELYYIDFEDDLLDFVVRPLGKIQQWALGSTSLKFDEKDRLEPLYALKFVDVYLTKYRDEAGEAHDLLIENIRDTARAQNISSRTTSLARSKSVGSAAPATSAQGSIARPASSAGSHIGSQASPSGSSAAQGSTLSATSSAISPTQIPDAQTPETETRLGLQTLLLIRAILMAMLLEMGPDTSPLYDEDFRDPIVKIL